MITDGEFRHSMKTSPLVTLFMRYSSTAILNAGSSERFMISVISVGVTLTEDYAVLLVEAFVVVSVEGVTDLLHKVVVEV